METNLKLKTVENKDGVITFKDLYESILEEIEDYKKLGMLDELMSQEVMLNICDQNGHVLTGHSTLMVGWLEGGGVLLTGNLDAVYEEKHIL